MNTCEMGKGQILAGKLAVISFTLVVLKLWAGLLSWVLSVNIWWFVLAFVVFALKFGYCKSDSDNMAARKKAKKKKTVKRKTVKKKATRKKAAKKKKTVKRKTVKKKTAKKKTKKKAAKKKKKKRR